MTTGTFSPVPTVFSRSSARFRRFVEFNRVFQCVLLLWEPLSVRRVIEFLDQPFDGVVPAAVAEAKYYARNYGEIARRQRFCQPVAIP